MKNITKNIIMKFATYFVVAFALSAFLITPTFAQSGLPCDVALQHPEIPWSEEIDGGTVNPSSDDCPSGTCQITFKYKFRVVTTQQGTFHDIIITEYTLSPGCDGCDFNEFVKMLWSIWWTRADEWGLIKGTNTYNHRFSAASCWRTTIGPVVEFSPCSTACCISRYNFSRASDGIITFNYYDPVQFSNNCTVQPCTHFKCDKIVNVNLNAEESQALVTANPGLGGGLGKENFRIDDYGIDNFSISPNPATDEILITTPYNQNEIYQVNIFNQIGEKILSHDINTNTESNRIRINVSDISNGLYRVAIYCNGIVIYSENIAVTR
ncbi:MAG: T9SS type A sorting domain-containing protein [Desulfobulbaceae bacterium]|nr:T9SS type A sorting domain-containing protein [Candidatus Kapabacteria bacterium]MBS4000959.1 T9SS type A sorting domain-containing protein [Desulfobulbaceae bacterium]